VAGILVLTLALSTSLLGASGVLRWTTNGVALRVHATTGAQPPVVTSDGSKGAIVAWGDYRTGTSDIYAQRVNAAGAPQWTTDGVALTGTGSSGGDVIAIASDGAGGAIVAWQDHRSGVWDIYARRVSSTGVPQWSADGVALRSGLANDARNPTIIPDGAGGAIVTWDDGRLGIKDIYAQRVDASGNVGPAIPEVPNNWIANGVALRSGVANDAKNPTVTADGAGGAIVTWYDGRSGVNDIYAQKVSSAGTPQWIANGVALRNIAGSNAQFPSITTDGAGGAVVSWQDGRSGSNNIYARKVSSVGVPQWTANGVVLRNITGSDAEHAVITSDGEGGAIVAWYDMRPTNDCSNIFVRKVNAGGTPQWTANGVALRNLTGTNNDGWNQAIIPDGSGGAIVSWQDNRSGVFDVYARKVSSTGVPQWTANGVALRSGLPHDANDPTIAVSGSGGAIVTWQDARTTNDIYAQRVTTTYSINVTQGAHGSIAPAGTGGVVTVNDGANQTFTIAPDPGYHTAGIKVDGSSVGVLTSYTFTNVTANHTITATFAQDEQPSDSSTWYLAEGTTAWGFSTYISITNPNTTAVHASITYMTGSGNVSGGTITLPAKSQTTVNPADKLGNQDFSTKIVCTEGKTIAVDRTMSWTGPGAASPEGHSSVGVTAPAKTWYLPEGCSAFGFETWLLIQNPNGSQANCQVTYMIEGEAPKTVPHTVSANSRQSFNMETDIGQKNASIKVDSNVPVIPERAMYRYDRREGHDSIGTTSPAADYYLAEGTTAWGFTTWVLIQNPGSSPSDVTITYMTPSGKKAQAPFSLAGNSRKTIKVNDVAGMGNTDFSTQVRGSSPIIAERSMYWDNGTGEACHDSIGMDSPHTTFYLPDGQTDAGRETWTLVQNPNSSAVTVEVSYLKAGGGAETLNASIPANSRMTFNMADKVPSGRASIMVKCTTPGKKIMCERAMYWNSRGAGTDTIGGFSD